MIAIRGNKRLYLNVIYVFYITKCVFISIGLGQIYFLKIPDLISLLEDKYNISPVAPCLHNGQS